MRKIFDELRFNTNTAITIFLKIVVSMKSLQFQLKPKSMEAYKKIH